jgi:hypothetical protein
LSNLWRHVWMHRAVGPRPALHHLHVYAVRLADSRRRLAPFSCFIVGPDGYRTAAPNRAIELIAAERTSDGEFHPNVRSVPSMRTSQISRRDDLALLFAGFLVGRRLMRFAVALPVRLTPGMRVYMAVLAGLTGFPYRRFLRDPAPAALIWAGAFIDLGRRVGERSEELYALLEYHASRSRRPWCSSWSWAPSPGDDA